MNACADDVPCISALWSQGEATYQSGDELAGQVITGVLAAKCRCCLDTQPRTLTVQDVNMLCNFAELVVREVEKQLVVGTTACWSAPAVANEHSSQLWFCCIVC